MPIIEIKNIDTETTGHNIRVPILINEPPAYLIYLHIELVGENENNYVKLL